MLLEDLGLSGQGDPQASLPWWRYRDKRGCGGGTQASASPHPSQNPSPPGLGPCPHRARTLPLTVWPWTSPLASLGPTHPPPNPLGMHSRCFWRTHWSRSPSLTWAQVGLGLAWVGWPGGLPWPGGQQTRPSTWHQRVVCPVIPAVGGSLSPAELGILAGGPERRRLLGPSTEGCLASLSRSAHQVSGLCTVLTSLSVRER